MPITKAEADTKLVQRCGAILALVGKDGSTVDGSNPDTVDALQQGMASLGLVPASFAAVTDADLSRVPGPKVPQLIHVAELQIVGSVSSSFTDVDETISMGSIKVSQNREAINVRYKSLAEFCLNAYGYGLGSLRAGRIYPGSARPTTSEI